MLGLGAAFAAEVEFNWHAGPPAVVNDAHWADFALQQATASGLEARVVEASPIGEDFAFISNSCPVPL